MTEETKKAPYAVFEAQSRGRVIYEQEAPFRSCYQRDRDRIIHSVAFRRLQYKTQVFVNHEGDFFRTRLTHSLEVAQIARTLARALRLDEDLTEAVALAHDLGHPPFGHAGERAINSISQDFGGFDHNVQSLRVVTEIETQYAAFSGLNMTFEMLEGLIKHNGPQLNPQPYIKNYAAKIGMDLKEYASAEAQIAALADDVAYHCHDLDDGLYAGLISLNDIKDLPLVGPLLSEVRAAFPDTGFLKLRKELTRRLIDRIVKDILTETRKRLAGFSPQSVEDIRKLPENIVAFSEETAKANKAIKAFLFKNMYRHWRVMRMSRKAEALLKEVGQILLEDPGLLPGRPLYADSKEFASEDQEKRLSNREVIDYIVGMTDRFALEEYNRLTDISVSG